MKNRVGGRRPVGRPRRTWLESVESDMAELEIDKEDVHDRKKWRRHVMQMTSQSHPHTQVRVQPRNTYNHTYTKFLPGQNKTTSY